MDFSDGLGLGTALGWCTLIPLAGSASYYIYQKAERIRVARETEKTLIKLLDKFFDTTMAIARSYIGAARASAPTMPSGATFTQFTNNFPDLFDIPVNSPGVVETRINRVIIPENPVDTDVEVDLGADDDEEEFNE